MEPNRKIITDVIDPTICHADGKIYTSRSKLRAAYAEHNVEFAKVSEFGESNREPEDNFEEIREDVLKAENSVRNEGAAGISERIEQFSDEDDALARLYE